MQQAMDETAQSRVPFPLFDSNHDAFSYFCWEYSGMIAFHGGLKVRGHAGEGLSGSVDNARNRWTKAVLGCVIAANYLGEC